MKVVILSSTMAHQCQYNGNNTIIRQNRMEKIERY